MRAWEAVYADAYRSARVTVGPPGRPRAVAHLVRRRRRPWTAEMLGVRELAEPTDVRVVDDAAAAELVAAMLATRLPIRLKRLPATSPLLPLLTAVPRHRALVLTRAVIGTPTIALDDTWREPEQRFSTRRRSDFRAALRRAEKLGAVELTVREPAPDEVDRLLDEVVEVEAAGWKATAGTALAVQPSMHLFFRTFCRSAAADGTLRLAFLRIDGRAVAVQLAVEDGGRYHLFKIGFDERFARCSPGNLLMLHTVRWAATRGLRSIEFLGIDEPWTRVWTEEVRRCVEVHVYPPVPNSVPAAAEFGVELARRVGPALRARRAARAEQGR